MTYSFHLIFVSTYIYILLFCFETVRLVARTIVLMCAKKKSILFLFCVFMLSNFYFIVFLYVTLTQTCTVTRCCTTFMARTCTVVTVIPTEPPVRENDCLFVVCLN